MGTIQMKTRWWIETPLLLDVVRMKGFPCAVSEGEQLMWSSNGRIPQINEMITVRFNDFGEAKVVGYFAENDYLGLIVEPVKLPDWYVAQLKRDKLVRKDIDPATQIGVFGAEIKEVPFSPLVDDRGEEVL
jgi:hypothetical protein